MNAQERNEDEHDREDDRRLEERAFKAPFRAINRTTGHPPSAAPKPEPFTWSRMTTMRMDGNDDLKNVQEHECFTV